jgi:GNAT superfamily N-acetyltransferase
MDQITVERASVVDAPTVSVMVGELLHEIMDAIGVKAFNFDLAETTARTQEYLAREKYYVFLARTNSEPAAGFVALYESYALDAEGAFGTIPELYVRPAYRSRGVGKRLLNGAKEFGVSRGWKRLEVTTPPLPQFERSLQFYEREGFAISGGRKLRAVL